MHRAGRRDGDERNDAHRKCDARAAARLVDYSGFTPDQCAHRRPAGRVEPKRTIHSQLSTLDLYSRAPHRPSCSGWLPSPFRGPIRRPQAAIEQNREGKLWRWLGKILYFLPKTGAFAARARQFASPSHGWTVQTRCNPDHAAPSCFDRAGDHPASLTILAEFIWMCCGVTSPARSGPAAAACCASRPSPRSRSRRSPRPPAPRCCRGFRRCGGPARRPAPAGWNGRA